MTDNDQDGVLDFMESQGILGTNKHIYYADPTKADCDEDGLSDAEELGVTYIFTRAEDGSLRILLNKVAQPISYSTTSMADHYVTITGVICDRISNETWLRVQTWGRIRYLNYSDFYNHISPSYPNTAMGSIIIPE